MFPDEVFLTLCCPKAEITEAYSIGETAINIPALEGAPIPIEIELTSTSLIGDLKDRLNIILGEMAGFSKGEIAELPRMTISTGRKTWFCKKPRLRDTESLRTAEDSFCGDHTSFRNISPYPPIFSF